MTNLQDGLPSPGGGYSFTFAGDVYAAFDEADLVAKIVQLFHRLDSSFLPKLRNRIRRWMSSKRVTRPFLATSPAELFPTSPHLAARYAVPVVEGWWIDRNNDWERKWDMIYLACGVAGVSPYDLDLSWSRRIHVEIID